MDESVKCQITDSISEILTDSDLESTAKFPYGFFLFIVHFIVNILVTLFV